MGNNLYQKSADTILANWIYTVCEGLNDRKIFFMKGKQEYNNGRQLQIEDYLQENKLETDDSIIMHNLVLTPIMEIDRDINEIE